MAETRAYLTYDNEATARVTVHPDADLYTQGTPDQAQSWTYPLTDDGQWHLFDAQPERTFKDADRVLAENGWMREGRWLVGDVITGTFARIARA